jgi:hypothetical protein
MVAKKVQDLEPLDVLIFGERVAAVWAPPEVDGDHVAIVVRGAGVADEPIVVHYQIDEDVEILEED